MDNVIKGSKRKVKHSLSLNEKHCHKNVATSALGAAVGKIKIEFGPLKQLQPWGPHCTSQTKNPKEGLAEARWGVGDRTFQRSERSPGREGRNDRAHAHLLLRDEIFSNLAWIQP